MPAPIALHYFYHDTRYILICTERQISAVRTGHTDKVGNLQKKCIVESGHLSQGHFLSLSYHISTLSHHTYTYTSHFRRKRAKKHRKSRLSRDLRCFFARFLHYRGWA